MLERGCNPQLFWDIHTLVLPALQQELTQLTLDEILPFSRISEYKQNASQEILCTGASPGPYSLLPSSLRLQRLSCPGRAGSSAGRKHEMGIVQGPWWWQLWCSYSNSRVVLAPAGSCSRGEAKAELQTRGCLAEPSGSWATRSTPGCWGAPGLPARGLADGEWRPSSAQCTFILLNTRLV